MSKLFTPEKQAEFIRDEMRAWIREDVNPALRAAIRKRERNIPSGMEDSLRHEIETGLGDALGLYTLSFPDAGRHVDMKNLNFEKRPIVEGANFILDWARKRGRNKFKKKIPGYGARAKTKLTEEQQLERIAGAIIASKTKKKHKRRGRWYNSVIQQLIGRLTGRLTRNQALWIQGYSREQIEEAFVLNKGSIKQTIRFK